MLAVLIHPLVVVVVPAALQAVQGVVPSLLVDSHARITDALSQLSHADPSSPALDLAVLEVVEVLQQHTKVRHTAAVGYGRHCC